MLKGRLGHTSKYACEIDTCVLKSGNEKWTINNVKPGIRREYRHSIKLKKKLLMIGKEKVKSDDKRFHEFVGETSKLPVSKLTNFDHVNPTANPHFDHVIQVPPGQCFLIHSNLPFCNSKRLTSKSNIK